MRTVCGKTLYFSSQRYSSIIVELGDCPRCYLPVYIDVRLR